MSTNDGQTDLLIDRLEIRDFRQYEHLSIDRLGRINLIVGKNGVGKTSLLEAVRILATVGAPHVLWEILAARDEQSLASQAGRQGFTNLFRRGATTLQMSISSPKRTLRAELGWYREIYEGDQFLRIEKVAAPSNLTVEAASSSDVDTVSVRPMVEVWLGDAMQRRISINRRYIRPVTELGTEYQCMFVGSSGVSAAEAARLWDKIALTALEDEVIRSLAMIYPGLTRISLAAGEDERTRIPRAKLQDYAEPVPLRTLGDGVSRIFGIALALVNAKDGVLLVDEIENGIHYSIQPQLWQFLAEAAKRFNVQMFATTHSSDAIKSFQWASKMNRDVEGLLTRLEEKAGNVSLLQLDESDLGVAVTEAIEVR
jgi:ABC-type transport system involved in cytochrome c biogenesis ATPase subunit